MAARKSTKGRGRQAVRNNSSGGMPGWGWAVIGILAGAILMAIVLRGSFLPLQRGDRNAPAPNAQATAKSATDPGVTTDQPEAEKPKKPTYDFYSVLSEKEVRIPDSEISAQAQAEAKARQQAAVQQAQQVAQQKAAAPATALPPTAPNTPAVPTERVTAVPATPAAPAVTGPSGYLLQVGAFPSASDAEALKAKLAMQGFVANVQTVKVGGQNYNRVRLGPFKSATDLESTKQRLQGAGISAIALKEGN